MAAKKAVKGKEVAKTEAPELKDLANRGDMNYFEQYGASIGQSSIVGQLLKFSKGDYLAGQDEVDVPLGTKLVVCMDQFMTGWIKWVDNKPAEQIMGPLVEGYQPPKRNTLGDEDKDQWEVDSNDKPRDPWQFTNYVILKPPGKPATDDHLYTFSASSKGGIAALAKVCGVYGREMRSRPDEYPIVTLGVSSYNHPNKEYGRIKTPTLEVVGWENKSLFDRKEAEDEKPKSASRKK